MALRSAIADVERLSQRVIRILGQNPGRMTGPGTNCYLVGTGRERLLIDTGEGVPKFAALLSELVQAEQCKVSGVVLTHWHQDHVGGLQDVLGFFPSAAVYKIPSRSDPPGCSAVTVPIVPQGSRAERLASSHGKVNKTTLSLQVEGATLNGIFSPGHTDDHLALWLEEERALFAGDCILGTGSAVFACFSDYMSSLSALLHLQPALIYPGHGAVLPDGVGAIRQYIQHRTAREAQIVKQLRPDQPRTAADLVKIIYHDTPSNLHAAAAFNVMHHLRKLESEGRAKSSPSAAVEPRLPPVAPLTCCPGGTASDYDLDPMVDGGLQWVLVQEALQANL
jgi:ribonuclease/clavin/mitogillin